MDYLFKLSSLSAEINLQDIDFQSCRFFFYAQKDAPKMHQNAAQDLFMGQRIFPVGATIIKNKELPVYT